MRDSSSHVPPAISGRVAIAGVGEADRSQAAGKTALHLQVEAAVAAIRDAGIEKGEIDAVFAHTGDRFSSMLLAEYLGIQPRYTDTTNIGGPSSLSHVLHAAAAIHAGLCHTALIAYGSTQASDRSRGLGIPDDPRSPRGQFELPYGLLTPLGTYALAAQRHMHQYGTTLEQLAEVAVATRRWAQLNPQAARREPLTLADVMASPPIASPLRLLDCCLVTDGAAAVVVTTAQRARRLARPVVTVLGAAEGHTHHYFAPGVPDMTRTGAVETGARAFAMAGVRPGEIDVVQIYDAFTIAVIIALEDLGFCGRGEGGPFVARQRTAPGGDFPLNTSGGGLSYCHPGMFGTFLLLEAVRQLRGECGDRQVAGARLALCHGTGAVLSSQATLILGRD